MYFFYLSYAKRSSFYIPKVIPLFTIYLGDIEYIYYTTSLTHNLEVSLSKKIQANTTSLLLLLLLLEQNTLVYIKNWYWPISMFFLIQTLCSIYIASIG